MKKKQMKGIVIGILIVLGLVCSYSFEKGAISTQMERMHNQEETLTSLYIHDKSTGFTLLKFDKKTEINQLIQQIDKESINSSLLNFGSLKMDRSEAKDELAYLKQTANLLKKDCVVYDAFVNLFTKESIQSYDFKGSRLNPTTDEFAVEKVEYQVSNLTGSQVSKFLKDRLVRVRACLADQTLTLVTD